MEFTGFKRLLFTVLTVPFRICTNKDIIMLNRKYFACFIFVSNLYIYYDYIFLDFYISLRGM